MHPNEQLIHTFYQCLAARDHAGMIACYTPDIEFSDPVFRLRGRQVGAMWHMLCESGTDLSVVAGPIFADAANGRAHWEARYHFSGTGREVHNRIDATFHFEQGLIARHHDRFSLWRWTGMALGPAGRWFGWTPWLRDKVRHAANRRLQQFIATHPEYQ